MRTWRSCARWLRAGGLCTAATAAAVGCIGPQEELVEPFPFQEEALVSPVSSFQDALAPYGEWIDLTGVGWVWRPHVSVVGAHFVPYATGGQWRYGPDIGWTFETEWAWGWAPFHYGRWFLAPGYGWVWWPDTVWGAAWVSWRFGGGFIGWAPLAPPFITWDPFWCFTAGPDFVRPYVGHYLVPRYRVGVVFHDTTAVADPWAWHHPWSPGPGPEFIERFTGKPPPQATLPPQPVLPIPGVTVVRPPPAGSTPEPGRSLPPVEPTPVMPVPPSGRSNPLPPVEAAPVLPEPPAVNATPPPPVEAAPVLPTPPAVNATPPPPVEAAPAPSVPHGIEVTPPPAEAAPAPPVPSRIEVTPPPPVEAAPATPVPHTIEVAPPPAPPPPAPAPPPPAPAPPPAEPAPPVTPRPPPADGH